MSVVADMVQDNNNASFQSKLSHRCCHVKSTPQGLITSDMTFSWLSMCQCRNPNICFVLASWWDKMKERFLFCLVFHRKIFLEEQEGIKDGLLINIRTLGKNYFPKELESSEVYNVWQWGGSRQIWLLKIGSCFFFKAHGYLAMTRQCFILFLRWWKAL